MPFWWLQLWIPRNKRIWVFGAWYGNRFADNSRSLFLYTIRNHPEIKCVWLTRNRAILKQVSGEGGRAHMVWSIKGVFHSLRASNVFISSGKRDVNPLFINGANWIQLWHGSPFKKIGLDDKYSTTNTFFQKIIVKNVFPFGSELNYHKIVSNASFFTPILASAFGVKRERVIETGSPRNDIFCSDKENPFNRELRQKFQEAKLLYYLPTFRGREEANSLFSLPDYDSEKLGVFLEEHNMVLVSKAHYVDNRLNSNVLENERIIHLADEDVSDINGLLKDADLLITDYSSIYFDFLLAEKPVIFAAFDLTAYVTGNRELPFQYEEVTSGPIVKNWKELYQELETIWSNAKYRILVKEKNTLFNKYHDEQNAKRVFDAVTNQ